VVIRAAVVQYVDRTLPFAELAKHLGCRNSVVVRIPSPVVSNYELHLLKYLHFNYSHRHRISDGSVLIDLSHNRHQREDVMVETVSMIFRHFLVGNHHDFDEPFLRI
jgi:hypothetical protein